MKYSLLRNREKNCTTTATERRYSKDTALDLKQADRFAFDATTLRPPDEQHWSQCSIRARTVTDEVYIFELLVLKGLSNKYCTHPQAVASSFLPLHLS
jgi:hypothetical protein